MKNQRIAYSLVLSFFFLIRPAGSQTIELSLVPDSVSTFEIDYIRTLYSGADQSNFSGLYNFQSKHILSHKLNLITKLGFSHFKDSFQSDDNDISNLYLGLQYKTSKSENINSALNVGVYAPF